MRGIRKLVLFALALALLAAPGSAARAQSDTGFKLSEGDPTTNDWTGFYAKVGLAIGFPDEDVAGPSPDIDAGAGIAFGGGYRWNRWLATEIDFNVIGGADIEDSNDDVTIFAFTVNVKGYPFAGLGKDTIPEWIQPYGLFGIGGGEVDAGDIGDESTFVVRFNVGSDFMLWVHFGLFFEAGYLVTTEDDTQLKGE